ncbi:phosphodiester glycosidase family protein [Weissella minor]|uniref:phosphodiester glycosidase family protein n=1 Tax=Weissella minor TaxID=1620 RepID=UPI003AF25EBB
MKKKQPAVRQQYSFIKAILISTSIFSFIVLPNYAISANDEVKISKQNEASNTGEILPKEDYNVQTKKSNNGSRMWITQIKNAKIGVGFPEDEATNGKMEYTTAPEYAQKHGLPVVSNASRFSYNKSGAVATSGKLQGKRMHQGKVFARNWNDTYTSYMTIANDNKTLGSAPNNVNLQDGDFEEVLAGCYPLIENGKPVARPIVEAKYKEGLGAQPRQIIYQLNDGTYGLMTIAGRSDSDIGASYEDMITEVQKIGNVKFAYNLDGGGSASTVIDGQLMNPVGDQRSPDGRPLGDFIYFYSDKLAKDPVSSKVTTPMPDKPTATAKINADGTVDITVKGVAGATVSIKTTDGKTELGTGTIGSDGTVKIKLSKDSAKSDVDVTQKIYSMTSDKYSLAVTDVPTKSSSSTGSGPLTWLDQLIDILSA